ncbi:transcriptional regulator [Jeotgalibacillus soli]|uniref:Transcriptional regulator n=2 Tax=Jeotgalibacillus soli TaxID=889306 RepID=A0A0C2VSX7_9BACL|nr:transcriptional regulator [Jeotgalibacillus soli]
MLTPKDRSLIFFLAEHTNQLFDREQLIEHVWGLDYDGSDRAVDLAIKRIRQAPVNWPSSEGEIKTMRGLGTSSMSIIHRRRISIRAYWTSRYLITLVIGLVIIGLFAA